jgi:hypothetical protein
MHFLVDAAGAATLFALIARGSGSPATPLVLAYGLISFASRPLLGLLVDAQGGARGAALAGGVIVAGSSLGFSAAPLAAVVAMAVGNALFHVGAGSICFRLEPGRAGPSGIFAGPGALGVFIGSTASASLVVNPWPVAIGVLACVIVARGLPVPRRQTTPPSPQETNDSALVLLLASVALVSFAGFALRFPWQSETSLGIAVIAAAAAGRGLGGLIADRFGWMRISLGGLLLSIPLFALGSTAVWAGLAGVFLFNVALPVASTAVFTRLRSHPAFAFGLVSLALIAGSLPMIAGVAPPASQLGIRSSAVILAAVALALGMRRTLRVAPAAERRTRSESLPGLNTSQRVPT